MQQGKISRIIGPVVDVRFVSGDLPPVLGALRIENMTIYIMSIFNTAGNRAIMIGIALGVAVIIAMRLVNASVFTSIRESVDDVAGRAVLSVVNGQAGFPEEILDRVREVPGVRRAVALILDSGLVSKHAARQVPFEMREVETERHRADPGRRGDAEIDGLMDSISHQRDAISHQRDDIAVQKREN